MSQLLQAGYGLGQFKLPGVPRIDWSHPLTNGLMFYGFDTGGTILDLARGLPENFVAGTTKATNTVTAYGTGRNWNNSDGRFFNSDAAIRAASAEPHTWACAYVQTGTVGDYTVPFGRTANDGSFPYINWGFEINSGAWPGQNRVVLDHCGSLGGPQTLVTLAGWSGNANNVFTSLVGTAEIPTLSLYAQGQFIVSRSDLTAISSFDSSDGIFFSGSKSSAPNVPFIGSIFYGAFWARILDASEILQLHLDPYCFLISPEYEMPAIWLSIDHFWQLYVSKNSGAYQPIGGTTGVLPADASTDADETKILIPRL